MASDFEVFGLDELIECFEALIDKWEEKKVVLLNKIGNILDAEIKPLVPVDTSRLADSFSFYVDVSGSLGSVEYGTNVEYALYVNDGHVQHKRFFTYKVFFQRMEKNNLFQSMEQKEKEKRAELVE